MDKIGKDKYSNENGQMFDDSPHIYNNVVMSDVVRAEKSDRYNSILLANLWKPKKATENYNKYEDVIYPGQEYKHEEMVLVDGKYVPMISNVKSQVPVSITNNYPHLVNSPYDSFAIYNPLPKQLDYKEYQYQPQVTNITQVGSH